MGERLQGREESWANGCKVVSRRAGLCVDGRRKYVRERERASCSGSACVYARAW